MKNPVKKPSWWDEFAAFAIKGNAMALAVGTIIGAAFSTITKSLSDDIIMPIVGVITGGTDFTQKFVALDGGTYATLEAAQEAGAAVMTYGNLIQAIINFLIVGLFIYWFLKMYEKSKKKEEEAPAAPAGPTQEELLAEIRDLLKK